MRLTDVSYISQQMFDGSLRQKFHENPDDGSVREQAVAMMRLVRGSALREQIVADIMHAARVSGHTTADQTAVIAFCMGLQFGFELAHSCPSDPR